LPLSQIRTFAIAQQTFNIQANIKVRQAQGAVAIPQVRHVSSGQKFQGMTSAYGTEILCGNPSISNGIAKQARGNQVVSASLAAQTWSGLTVSARPARIE
jgi:hypothetical protein